MRKNEARWIPSRQRWQINVQQDGERKTFTSSIPFRPGKKIQPGKIEAEKKADKWLDDHILSQNTRVEKMLDKFYEHLKDSTSKSHYRQYDGYIRNWVKPVIGAKRIGSLSQNDLQSVIDKAYSKGNLSDKTLKNIRGCLMAFMKYCRGDKVTSFHPDTLKIPGSAKKSEKSILTPDDIITLFSVSTTVYHKVRIEDPNIHAYRFAVLTGMRPGELLGLMKSNIKNSKITITQSYNDYNEMTQGKNDNARRTYKLGPLAKQVLDDQHKMLSDAGKISKYVFPGQDLKPMSQETFRRAWKRYCRSNGISTEFTPYEMRHTFVSVNVEMPAGLKKLVIGHSKNMDTEGTYGHEREEDWDLAAEYIDNAFMKILKKTSTR